MFYMCFGTKSTQEEECLPSYTESTSHPKNFIMDDTFYDAKPNSLAKVSKLVNTLAKPKIIENVNVVNFDDCNSMAKASKLVNTFAKPKIIENVNVVNFDEIKDMLKKMNKKINQLDKKISTFKHQQSNEKVTEQIKDKDWYVKNIKKLTDNHTNCVGKTSQFINICNVYNLGLEYLTYKFDKKFYNTCLNKIEELLNSELDEHHTFTFRYYYKQLKIINIKNLTKNKEVF